ncbi:MAG: DNA polymerase, partial [Ruthenibacterium sp.]
YLLAPTDGSYALESLGQSYFNFQPLPAKDYLSPEAFGPLTDSVPALAALMSHCALINALYDVQKDKLEDLKMHELYYDIELPLCAVLAQMERAGFLVDRTALTKFGVMLDGRMKTAQTDIFARAGMEFNLNSPKQMGEVLFEKLGLPPLKKTKSGYSTNADVLEKLRDKDPIIGSILEYRQLSKLKSTYVDGLDKVIG